jgi:Cu2+-exporting ATPase
MKCGGCSAAVKRILSNQPGVVNAAVNLLTETAAITVTSSPTSPESLESPVPSAAGAAQSQHALELGSKAAEALSSKGFPSKLRASESSAVLSDEAEAKRAAEARASLVNLAVAGSLVVLCCTHHVGHLLHALGYHQFAHGAFMQVGCNLSCLS